MAQFKDGHRVRVFHDPDGRYLEENGRAGTVCGISEDAIFVLLDLLPGQTERDLWSFEWHDGMTEFPDVHALAADHMQKAEAQG